MKKKTNISQRRLINQQLKGTKFKTPKDIVSWMGAMQAQDYNMAKLAIGVRLPESTDKMIEEAFNKGEILRTHLLRPTWHFVSADDIYWLLELTGPRLRASLETRHKELGITEKIINQSQTVIKKSLAGGRQLSRDELIAKFRKAKISCDSSQAYHLLITAEFDGLICSGSMKGKEQTYALLADRAPRKKKISREEALEKLAQKYFSSHGPATLQDFIWWSGLSAADARKALESASSKIVSEKIDSQLYWSSRPTPATKGNSAYLLPAFDEFIISYRDRTPSLRVAHHSRAISSNGIFKPVVVADNHVIGTWKKILKKGTLRIELNLFEQTNKNTKILIEKAALAYGKFLNQKIEII